MLIFFLPQCCIYRMYAAITSSFYGSYSSRLLPIITVGDYGLWGGGRDHLSNQRQKQLGR